MNGEDDARWRWVFNNGKCEEIQAKISWDEEIIDKKKFVKKCGEILRIAKPHLVGYDYKLGKDLPSGKFEQYLDDDEFVVVKCENGYSYKLDVTSNSMISIAAEIFNRMVHK